MTLPDFYLHISIAEQRLFIIQQGTIIHSYPVSTATKGAGEQQGSGCTPRGWHCIRAKIGKDTPRDAVFIGRRWTGEIYSPMLQEKQPERDWILTRILWLGGLEPGFNRYGNVDTTWRYIYIHGSPDHGVSGQPASHGCIRMTSEDILDLFDKVQVRTRVFITESLSPI
jgi:lipoprotein-anchoring transpeptidase ErfK/SrfK